MCLKNRMYFDIAAVPAVVQACVTLYNFILTEDGVAKDDIFHDDMPTRRARASRRCARATRAADGSGPSGAGGVADMSARQRETDYLATHFMVQTWGEEGSAADRARLRTEASYRTHGAGDNETEGEGAAVMLPNP